MTDSELKEVARQVTDILLANGKSISDSPIKYTLDGSDRVLIDSNKVLSFIEFSQFNNSIKNYNHYSEEDLDTITEYGLYYIGPFSSSMTDGSKRQILLVTSNNFHTVEGFDVPIKHAIQEFTSIDLNGTYNKKVRSGYGIRNSDGSEQWTWGEWEIKDIPAVPYGNKGLSLCGAGESSDFALASGNGSRALGSSSVSVGYHTVSKNTAESSMGSYNKSNAGTTTADQTIWSVGNGSSELARENAAELRKNGDLYVSNRVIAYAGKSNQTDIVSYLKNNASRTTSLEEYSTYMVTNILSITDNSTPDEIRRVFGIESPTNVDFFDEYISKGTTFVDYEESDNMYYQMTAYALNGNTMFECNDVIFNFDNTSDPISVSVYKKNQTNKLMLRNAGLADFNTGMTNAEIMNAFGLGSSSRFDDLFNYVKKYDFAKNNIEGWCGIYNINIQTSNAGKIVMSASAYDTGNLDPYSWVVQISKDASGNAMVESAIER